MKSEILKTTKKDLFMVDPRNLIEEENFNTRFELGNIDELAESIKENGVKKPLLGFKVTGQDKYVLTDGHRRFVAIQKIIAEATAAGKDIPDSIKQVPIITDKETRIVERTINIILSNDGMPLNPVELATSYKRLIDNGMTQMQIAKKIGKSQAHVATTLRLVNVSETTKQAIVSGKVSVSTVRDMINKKSDTTVIDKKIAAAVSSDKKVTRKDVGLKQKLYTKNEVDAILAKQLEAIKKLVGEEALVNFSFEF